MLEFSSVVLPALSPYSPYHLRRLHTITVPCTRLTEMTVADQCDWATIDGNQHEDDGNTTAQLLVWLHPAACWWSAVLVLLVADDTSTCQSAAVTQCHHQSDHMSICLHHQSAHHDYSAQLSAAGETCCQVQTADVLFQPCINVHTAITIIQCSHIEISINQSE